MASTSFEAGKLFSCKGLVAVITGGGSGLGSYTARALDANGAKAVYLIGRRKEALDKVVGQCTNGSARAIVGDVTSKESLAAAAAQVESEVGYINVLFANSGVSGTETGLKLSADCGLEEFVATSWAAPTADFTAALNVNVTGVFYTALAFLKLLDAGNTKSDYPCRSQVLTTASVAGISRRLVSGYDYSASKAAVVHMTKMMATQFARWKIRANCIAPGFFPSEMTAGSPVFQGSKDPSKEGGLPLSFAPLERAGSEEDFAGTVLYLMSPAGSYVDGSVMVIDGGRLAILPSTY